MHPALAELLHARALELDAQSQSAEDSIELACHLGFSFAPTTRNGERLHFRSAFVGGIDHHRNLISALVTQFFVDYLCEHFRKEGLFQVTGIEGNAAQHNSIA